MHILFISDIHLGNPLFYDFIKLYELLLSDKYSEIVIVGDLLDVWEYKLDKLCKRYKGLISIINRVSTIKKVVIIKGNHDTSIKDLKIVFPNAVVCERYECINNRCIVLHGDAYDDFYLKFEGLAKFFFPVQWFFQRFDINIRLKLQDFYRRFIRKYFSFKYDEITVEVEKKILDEFYGSYDYSVMGHTHSPKIFDYLDMKYINCGDWIKSKSYVEYDIEEDIFTLVYF